MKKAEPLRLGFIGGGVNSAVGNTHFIAAQMDGLFKVEAGCFSRHRAVNSETAQKWGVPSSRVYETWEDLLNQEAGKLDAVVVLTPTPLHREPVIEAIRAGFPVVCEKAMAVNSADASTIRKVVDECNGFLSVTYNYTGYPMLRELRRIIASGKLGELEQVHVEMPQEGYARIDGDGNPIMPQQWRLEDSGVPTISLDLGVHVHHLIDFLTREKPTELVAVQSTFGQFRQVIDNTMSLVRYTNGLESCIWFSKAALGYRNGLRVRVFGNKGAAEWYQLDPEFLMLYDRQGRKAILDRANVDVEISNLPRYNRFKSGHPSGFIEAFANLYADIGAALQAFTSNDEASFDYVFSATQAWEGLIMLEAMTTSSRERRWVEICLEQ